ncbi:MAG: hypothetical protein IKW78_06390, partial [Prevotella sp.]|nr:hypothetical protein [Prevotella sp.]
MMKKSVILFISLLLANAVSAAGFPNLSNSDNEYWYYLKFTQGVYVVASNGEDAVCKAAIPTGKSAQLWKVEGSASDGYTFTNKLGLQLYAVGTAQGSEIRAGRSPQSLQKFKINTRGSNYTITPFSNTGQAFNCWGGMGFKNDIKLYDSGDANAPMEFIAEGKMAMENALFPIVPYPQSIELTNCGNLDLHYLEGIIYVNDSTKMLAERFARDLGRTAGIDVALFSEPTEVSAREDYEHPYMQLILESNM